MKLWKYWFEIHYGVGQGIVIADTKEEAMELVKNEAPYLEWVRKNDAVANSLEIEEEVEFKKGVIDFSWLE